jgi:hypothetical protein
MQQPWWIIEPKDIARGAVISEECGLDNSGPLIASTDFPNAITWTEFECFQSDHPIIAQDSAAAETTSRIARAHAARLLLLTVFNETSLMRAWTTGQIVARIALRWLMGCADWNFKRGVKSSPDRVRIETIFAVMIIPNFQLRLFQILHRIAATIHFVRQRQNSHRLPRNDQQLRGYWSRQQRLQLNQ